MALPSTLDRSRRIRRRTDFKRIQALSKRVVTRHFVLLVAARLEERCRDGALSVDAAGSSNPRLGLVASRRIGGAVARNRVKRLCRECFRLFPGLLPAGIDLVVIARDGADCMKLQEVRAEWERVVPALRRHATEALARTESRPHVSPATQPLVTKPAR